MTTLQENIKKAEERYFKDGNYDAQVAWEMHKALERYQSACRRLAQDLASEIARCDDGMYPANAIRSSLVTEAQEALAAFYALHNVVRPVSD